MLLAISNLYPRPDEPQRGLFNAQLFTAMGGGTGSCDGIEYSILNFVLVPEWRPWRWRSIRAWTDPYTDRLNTRYVPVGYVPVIGRHLNWRLYLRGLASYAEQFEQCDAVLVTWLYPDGVAAAAMAQQAEKPVWLKAHGTDRFHLDHPARRKHILAACDYAEGIICNAHSIKEQLIARGLPESKVHVIPNGVNTTRFRYRPKQEAHGELQSSHSAHNPSFPEKIVLPENGLAKERIILFIGNLVPIKAPDLLLHSVFRIPHSAFVFLGSGPLLPTLQRQAQRLGIADRVTFLGSRPHEEVALWMNLADGLCLPSRSEGMPNVVLEALASGLPVVATDVGDCRRVLTNEPEARIVPVGDADAMAEGLQDVLAAACDREAMSHRHRSQVSWQTCVQRHLKVMGIVGDH